MSDNARSVQPASHNDQREAKEHSYEWFRARSEAARAEMQTWPEWMQKAAHWRVAAFPPNLPR